MQNSENRALDEPAYRSGAVARLTGIPVQTLRVWERRYKIVGPRLSATGQRLYAPSDVARLAVIKQLVLWGHAIGSIAALDHNQLRAMFDKASAAAPGAARHTGQLASNAPSAIRVVIVGETLALRTAQQPLSALQIVATIPNTTLAADALAGVAADALVIELPTLRRETPQTVRALTEHLGARRIIVEYGFGAQRVLQELRALGCSLVHAPMDLDRLESLCGASDTDRHTGKPAHLPAVDPAATRRFDNKALAQISTTSVKLECECAHHLCELLVRLGNFETYSAECENSSPADAVLHHYLKKVAGNARAMLEDALVLVCKAEGLAVPT